MKGFTAGKNEEGVRLSRFVQSVTAGLPTSMLYKSFRNKRIKVNGRRAAPEDRLHEGDLVELYLNDEFFPAGPAKAPAPRRRAPLTVVYEDDALAVLYKPPHLLCHPDRTGDDSHSRIILPKKAGMTRRRRPVSPPRCATGWTGAPRGW